MACSATSREGCAGVADLATVVRPLIRDVPDFPYAGVQFKDLTPVFADPTAFRAVVEALAATAPAPDAVLGIEARGFLLGAAVAYVQRAGVVTVRKPNKLPVVADSQSYTLEYDSARLELPAGTLRPGQRVLVIDDVLATGGTVAATCHLAERAGATVLGVAVVLEIEGLGGRGATPHPVHALLSA